MDDYRISGWTAAAGVLWMGSMAIVVAAFALEDPHLGDVGIVASIGAATLTMRGFLVRQRRLLRAAFHLGEVSSREEEPPVRLTR